ncbi:c-type cytochrome [Pelagicoccus sp. SDUM812005]|uniref:c-type cytochrome n=1 Tax=Pelagicoccus sp. SDUM812005 TaxID=3041257 RepID=UPI00280D12D4|nr:c-type cytochrome [Pelagicoccus sp. SDUM812005]MDQ8179794.1 c-type cytochrome [Pelagicoccus sp. SDUM812005]
MNANWKHSLAILALALVACGEKPSAKSPAAFDPTSVPLDDPDLAAGQQTWSSTCATCHLSGLTGAPIIGNKTAWAPRIAQGLETLYDHALNGFIGPEYTEMPPKGGFAELTDEQVKQAVRFMTHLSQ